MGAYRHMTIKIYNEQFEVLYSLAKEYNKSVSSIIRALLSFGIDSLNDPNLRDKVIEYIKKEFGMKTKPLILSKEKIIVF